MASPKWISPLSEAVSKYPKAKSTPTLARPSIIATMIVAYCPGTTDVRTPKVSQLYSSISGSRSGCVAELAWWIEEAGEQYRIAADTYVMPKPGHDLHGRLPFEKLGDYSEEVVSMEERMQWWERERVNTFDDKMGDILRASFVRPEPGSVLVGGYKSAMEWPERLSRSADVVEGSKEAEQVTEALSNFALLVFRPYKVERIELGITPNRRTSWEWKNEEEGWKESILVP